MLELLVENTADEITRENMRRIMEYVRTQALANANVVVREIVFPKALTNFRYPHGLPFTPKDVVLLSTLGAGVLTINYKLFDKDYLDFTTTDACTVRLLIGILGVQ